MILNDEFYMDLALQLASRTVGQTGINPAVGCVIVQNGAIVGLGAHLMRGSHHAEIHALQMAGELARAATVYVTLEPCSHVGKTGPCCEALLAAGVSRVVVACLDPNPLVSGNGVARLRNQGVAVEVGLFAARAQQMNEVFFTYVTRKTPFVAVKTASTLDGKLAAKTGDSRWISGEDARMHVHYLRHTYSAIMVGVETVLKDNPHLNARNDVSSLQPWKIVVDSRLRTPIDANVIASQPGRTIFLTTSLADPAKRAQFEALGVRLLECGNGPHVHLPTAMSELGACEIPSILLEGGGTLNGAMLAAGLIDKAYLFIAAKLIGGHGPYNFQFAGFDKMSEAIVLHQQTVETIGEDILVTGYFRKAGGDS